MTKPRRPRGQAGPEVTETGYIEKDVPQPQVDLAFGFSNTKPLLIRLVS